VCRRIVGIAHVEDLESIKDASKRAECERAALNCAKTILKGRRQFETIEQVIEHIQSFDRDWEDINLFGVQRDGFSLLTYAHLSIDELFVLKHIHFWPLLVWTVYTTRVKILLKDSSQEPNNQMYDISPSLSQYI